MMKMGYLITRTAHFEDGEMRVEETVALFVGSPRRPMKSMEVAIDQDAVWVGVTFISQALLVC